MNDVFDPLNVGAAQPGLAVLLKMAGEKLVLRKPEIAEKAQRRPREARGRRAAALHTKQLFGIGEGEVGAEPNHAGVDRATRPAKIERNHQRKSGLFRPK